MTFPPITKTDYTKTDHNQNGLPEKNMYCKNLYLFIFFIISCVFIGYKNVFGPIAVFVANRFRLEQKSYLPLKLHFMSDFGKTTIFNGLLGNRPNFFANEYTANVIYCSPQLCIFIEPINTRFLHVYM
jgi:hypothetical protein